MFSVCIYKKNQKTTKLIVSRLKFFTRTRQLFWLVVLVHSRQVVSSNSRWCITFWFLFYLPEARVPPNGPAHLLRLQRRLRNLPLAGGQQELPRTYVQERGGSSTCSCIGPLLSLFFNSVVSVGLYEVCRLCCVGFFVFLFCLLFILFSLNFAIFIFIFYKKVFLLLMLFF